MMAQRKRHTDLGARLPEIRLWLKADYQAEIDRGDPRAWFISDDPKGVVQLNYSSPYLSQLRRILGYLDTAATVYIDYSRIRGYPPAEDVGWFRNYRGGVAVAADGTISPAGEGVEVYP
jgi:hypothetical protein